MDYNNYVTYRALALLCYTSLKPAATLTWHSQELGRTGTDRSLLPSPATSSSSCVPAIAAALPPPNGRIPATRSVTIEQRLEARGAVRLDHALLQDAVGEVSDVHLRALLPQHLFRRL